MGNGGSGRARDPREIPGAQPRVLQRTELAFSQASLGGLGSCQRQSFLSSKCGLSPHFFPGARPGDTVPIGSECFPWSSHLLFAPQKGIFCLLGKVEVVYT